MYNGNYVLILNWNMRTKCFYYHNQSFITIIMNWKRFIFIFILWKYWKHTLKRCALPQFRHWSSTLCWSRIEVIFHTYILIMFMNNNITQNLCKQKTNCLMQERTPLIFRLLLPITVPYQNSIVLQRWCMNNMYMNMFLTNNYKKIMLNLHKI